MYTHTVLKAILNNKTGVSLPTIAVGPAVTCHSWPLANAAHPKSGEETVVATSNDNYVEIMEVGCLL